jgi:SAM-dependent methyltransferase
MSQQSGHWFESLADHLGAAYLRYSFTYGTEHEVDFVVDALGLSAGMRVLDVGCGPGRHAHALARRGMVVHGVDISERFIDLARATAPAGATFARADARTMGFSGEFDAVISLCQGAFGLAALPGGAVGIDPDGVVLERMARALVPGGRLALSVFSAYFQVRHLGDEAVFDAANGVNHERTEIRDEAGSRRTVDLWTSCFTPRELRLLAFAAGLEVEGLWAVRPGEYARRPPDYDHEEFLLVARRR